MSLDGKTPFEHWCRRPGTRCDRIMRMIEAGFADAAIAEHLKNMRGMPQNRDVDASVIAVYRKAYNGTLTTEEHHTPPSRPEDRAARQERILKLHAKGMTSREIAQETGISSSTVRSILAAHGEKEPKKPRKHKKKSPDIFEEIGVDRETCMRLMEIFGGAKVRSEIKAIRAQKREDRP